MKLYAQNELPTGWMARDPEQPDPFFCVDADLPRRQHRVTEWKFLSYYGREGRPPPKETDLLRDEEDAAFKRFARRRNAKDCEILVRKYLCWAFGLAARYKGPRLDFDEAVSVANLGLMEALYGFKPSKGYRFTTYAFFVVRRKLIEAIVGTYPVKISDHLRKSLREVSLSPDEAARDIAHHEEPRTLEEFFDRLGESVPIEQLHVLHDRPEDAPFAPSPALDPSHALERADVSAALRRALSRLTVRERDIVLARHFRSTKPSYEQLGRRWHISKNRARDIGEAALRKLRLRFNWENN